MGRPTNESKKKGNYLKEQCQAMENYLNELEEVCKSSNSAIKEDLIATIALLIGKLSIRFTNIESELQLYEDE